MELSTSTNILPKTPVEVLTFHAAGVKYRPLDVIESLKSGDLIHLEVEPTNEYDTFAIKVLNASNELIGYVPKRNTWVIHLLRKANIPIHTMLLVNLALRSEEQLLVAVTFYGNPEAEIINI